MSTSLRVSLMHAVCTAVLVTSVQGSSVFYFTAQRVSHH